MTSIHFRVLRTAALTLLLCCSAFAANAAGFFTSGGHVYDASGNEIQIRGINHQGFNSVILQPQFLWAMGWKDQIAQIKSLGFTAVRLPFVPDTLYSTAHVDQLGYLDASKNSELIGKTPLEALDLWMAEADRQGLYVLLDFHSVSMQRQYPTWYVSNPADFGLIYNKQAYTKDNWIRDLTFVAKRYASNAHFIGIDLYNEPNGVARWNAGDPNMTDPNNYWKPAAEAAANAILAANPNLLIFAQGVSANYDGIEDSSIVTNWGEDMQPQAYAAFNIPANKLVLAPHTYGPDVSVKPTFSAPNYPANLAADWEKLFGQFYPTYAVMPGEFGGKYGVGGTGTKDVQWQNAFVDYMISKGMSNSFYWCYTPNSSDTGGILDDNLNVRTDKMELLKRLWASATSTAPAPIRTPSPTPAPNPSNPTPAPVANPPVATQPVAPPSAATATEPAATTGGNSGGGGFDVIALLALGLAALWRGRDLRIMKSATNSSTSLPSTIEGVHPGGGFPPARE